MNGEFGLEKKKKIQSRFFALIPVVETVCFINEALLIQLCMRGWISISVSYIFREILICHNARKQSNSRTLQSTWAPMSKTSLDNSASERIQATLMIHTLPPPPQADSARKAMVQRRHWHLQQDRNQWALPAIVKQWITGGLITVFIPQVFSVLRGRQDGFQGMTERDRDAEFPVSSSLRSLNRLIAVSHCTGCEPMPYSWWHLQSSMWAILKQKG